MSNLKAQIEAARSKIRRLTKLVQFDAEGALSVLEVPDDSFVSSENLVNVRITLSALNKAAKEDITVMSCTFGENGEILPHKHPNYEQLHVLAGKVKDTLTGKVYKEGSIIEVQPNELHGFKSDYALLTIIWRPAFEYETQEVLLT